VAVWDIAIPLAVMGSALPFFFIPTTTIALGSMEEYEMDSAGGLMNFLRTPAGAAAKSIVITVCASQTTRNHAELVGVIDAGRSVRTMMKQSGMSADAVSLSNGGVVMKLSDRLREKRARRGEPSTIKLLSVSRRARRLDKLQKPLPRQPHAG
jgi:DHA2 family multidrug resistance protein